MAARVKLTAAEGASLVGIAVEKLGAAVVVPVLASALPADKVARLLRRESTPLTVAEKKAIVEAVIPLLPGKTPRQKINAVVKAIRPAFATRARYDEVMAYVNERVKMYLSGGQASGSAAPSANLPALGSRPLRGYGRANDWWKNTELLDAETTAMQKADVRVYTFEMAGHAKDRVLSDPAKLEQVKAAYVVLLGHCRAKGLYAHPTPANDNMGQRKWGDPGIPLSAVLPAAKKLCDFVREQGPANVIFQPCNETQTAAGRALEDYAYKTMPGFTFICNGSAGHPAKVDARASYRAFHSANIASWPNDAARTASVSDHSGQLAQLNTGGISGEERLDVLTAWIGEGVKRGYLFTSYYDFSEIGGIDYGAISACGVQGPAAPVSRLYADDIDLSRAVWIGPDGSRAIVTESLEIVRSDKEKVYFTLSKGSDAWEPHQGAKQTNQYVCAFFMRNGVPTGGKFDHSTWSRKDRELKNLRDNYLGFRPVAGEPWWLLVMDVNGTKRTPVKRVGNW